MKRNKEWNSNAVFFFWNEKKIVKPDEMQIGSLSDQGETGFLPTQNARENFQISLYSENLVS